MSSTERSIPKGIGMLGVYSEEEKIEFMRKAAVEGRLALPHCKPNPPVGSVLVGRHSIWGVGHTQPPGEMHAEVAAMADLQRRGFILADADMFVTLEPCSFRGRTPSCAKAIVDAGIRRVFIGIIDPDPRNRGRGVQLLLDGGVAVEIGISEEEISNDLIPYLGKS